MRTLLIGTDPYKIFDIWGIEIHNSPNNYEILMLYIDDSPLGICDKLCREAIIAQKRHDLFRLGKEVGIKKIANLDISKYGVNVERLSIQLKLYITIGGIRKIWFHSLPDIFELLLNSMIKKFNVEIAKCDTQIDIEYRKKLNSLMIGK